MENSSYIQDKGKDIQGLERYGYIVDYFKRNKGRVVENEIYLDYVCDLLIKPFPEKIDVSDEDIQEKVCMLCMYKEANELANELESITTNKILGKKRLKEKLDNIKLSRKKEGKPI